MFSTTSKIITCFILILASFSVKAQSEIYVDKKESEIEIITRSGEHIFGKTRYNFIADLQEEIVFYSRQNEMQVFKPMEIESFIMENKQFVSLEQPGLIMGFNRIFAHRIADGKMKLYTLYFVESNSANTTQAYYVQKNSEKLLGINDFRFLNFKKGMSNYVNEFPELAQRIADKTYTSNDLLTIVDEYNGFFELQAASNQTADSK
jgi:hypothetical protein